MSVAALDAGPRFLRRKTPPLKDLIPLSEIGKLLPNKPGYWTVLRWHTRGCKHRDDRKKVVRLAAWRMPCGLATTLTAVERFIRDLNE